MKCSECVKSSPDLSEMWESSTDYFFDTLKSLDSLWKEIGFNTDQLAERTSVFRVYLEKVLKRLIKEEREQYNELCDHIENGKKEIEQIYSELGMVPEEAPSSAGDLSLLGIKAHVSSKLNQLKEEKHSREKRSADLREHEQRLCETLGEPPFKFISAAVIPSCEDLTKLEDYIKTLEFEKECRQKEMASIKVKVAAFMEETEFLPDTSFGTSFIYSNDESIILSQKNLEEMREMVRKADSIKLEIANELASVKEKLETLWTRLGVSEEQRKQFLTDHNGCKMSVITAFQREIQNLEETRKQNMASYISQMRIEIINLWDKCYISQNERENCTFFWNENYTEELLDMHDEEVQRLKLFYQQNENLFTKLIKRRQLWERMIEFEKKSNDPNRYNNRGGGLLQEEKERNRLVKEFSKLETEILDAVKEYEERTGKDFLIKGQRFEQFVENQRNQLVEEREREKQERKRRSALVDVSTNRSTLMASKRRLVTPTTTPSKHRRMDSEITLFKTPRVMSRANTHVYPESAGPRTNNCKTLAGQQVPKTTPRRKVTMAQNENQLLRSARTKRRLLDESVSSYKAFSEELNKKTKEKCRSSCKYPLRSLGTPTSTGSIYGQSKLRGKLELPFLL